MYKKFIEAFRWYSPILIGLFMGQRRFGNDG